MDSDGLELPRPAQGCLLTAGVLLFMWPTLLVLLALLVGWLVG